MLISNNQLVFQLSIVYGMIGFWESAPPHVELAQELIRELRLLRKQMEVLAMDNLTKSKSAKSENARVSTSIWNVIVITFYQIPNEYRYSMQIL